MGLREIQRVPQLALAVVRPDRVDAATMNCVAAMHARLAFIDVCAWNDSVN